MKNVVIFFGLTDQYSGLPTRSYYREAYELLYPLAQKEGLQLYRSSLSSYDLAQGVFREAWTYNEENGWHEVYNVKPDLLEDRSRFTPENHAFKMELAKKVPMLNNPEFTKIANSKFETSELLPQHFKIYRRVANDKELEEVLSLISGKLVVAKPEFGSGGTGVLIETPEQLRTMQLAYPLILQEFIDSSHGIPGITPSYHDLRLVFINDHLIYSYIRIPKAGSLLANVAQGGHMEIIPTAKLPASLSPIIEDVKKVFARFPRKIYTIDLMFDEQARPWIVELNTMPGVYFSPGQEKERDRFYAALIQELKDFS